MVQVRLGCTRRSGVLRLLAWVYAPFRFELHRADSLLSGLAASRLVPSMGDQEPFDKVRGLPQGSNLV